MAAERPGSQPERPASQMSGAGKRKSSPKFHFLKNHRHKPNPIGARANTPGICKKNSEGTFVPQVLKAHNLIRWLKNFEYFLLNFDKLVSN